MSCSEKWSRIEKQEQEKIKQEKLTEIAKHRRRTDYKCVEKVREERGIDEKILRARNLLRISALGIGESFL